MPAGTQTRMFLFVNDSWFISYFIKILKTTVKLISAKTGLPILYIGSSDYKEIPHSFDET